MAITQVSSLDQTVVASYESDYLLWAEKSAVWQQIVKWQEAIPDDGGGGSSYDWPVYHEMEPATTALTETLNPTPVALGDSNITVTPTEYGNVAQLTQKLRLQARTSVREAAMKILGQNHARTVDRLVRNSAIGGSWVYRVNNRAARSDLVVGDVVTYAFLQQLVAQARAAFIPAFEGDQYLSIVNPLLAADLRNINQFLNPSYYQNQMVGGLLRGEIGSLAGIRFIEHPYGKMYMAGGTPDQAATTLAASLAAGASTLSVASSSGLAAGDYVVLGTLEAATADVVYLTAQSGVSYSFRGIGNAFGSFGAAFSQASGAAVTEAPNVGAIPIIGSESLWGVYGQSMGKLGQLVITTGSDTGDWLDRFLGIGWKWYGGFGRAEQYLLRGEAGSAQEGIGKVVSF